MNKYKGYRLLSTAGLYIARKCFSTHPLYPWLKNLDNTSISIVGPYTRVQTKDRLIVVSSVGNKNIKLISFLNNNIDIELNQVNNPDGQTATTGITTSIPSEAAIKFMFSSRNYYELETMLDEFTSYIQDKGLKDIADWGLIATELSSNDISVDQQSGSNIYKAEVTLTVKCDFYSLTTKELNILKAIKGYLLDEEVY